MTRFAEALDKASRGRLHRRREQACADSRVAVRGLCPRTFDGYGSQLPKRSKKKSEHFCLLENTDPPSARHAISVGIPLESRPNAIYQLARPG